MQHRKERTVPKTLLLEQHMELALNPMIRLADEDHGYIPFFSANFLAKPAWMLHEAWDYGSSHGRFIDSIILARTVTGSAFGEEIEQHYRENLLSFFRADGLNYRKNTYTQAEIDEAMSTFRESASMIDQRAVLMGLISWYLQTGEERIRERANRHVQALHRIALKERDSMFYPASEYTETGWPSFDASRMHLTADPCAMWGRQIFPLVRHYNATGDMTAFTLAQNFAYNIIYRSGSFLPDGSFNIAQGYRNGHFHTRLGTLAAIAYFAQTTNDAQMFAWVKKSYDWALTKCTSFGWTPGDLYDQCYEHETCTLVDMIDIAILLGKNGYSECWSHVEKFVRNHLTRAQLTDSSWIEDRADKSMDEKAFRSYYQTAQRVKGAFAGFAAPNDFVYDGPYARGHVKDIMACCTAGGGRGLYNTWCHCVTERHGIVRVNLLLTHSSPWVDVSSHLPHDGLLELVVCKNAKRLEVRIPEWVPYGLVEMRRMHGEDSSSLNGRQARWVNQCYLDFGEAREGERIEVRFPVVERHTTEKAMQQEFQTRWLGDDVVDISPQGTYYPLYKDRPVYETVPMEPRAFLYYDHNLFL